MKDSKKVIRRRHSAERKARVLSECAQPGASVASVAMSHGINANVVHKWRRVANVGAVAMPAASFIPVALPAPQPQPDIRMELRRGTTTMSIAWPAAAAAECAAWMRELLR
ncbi:MAG: transposase [Burkholderiales bacterium]|nr:transposase [Burkholderiales bacterium]